MVCTLYTSHLHLEWFWMDKYSVAIWHIHGVFVLPWPMFAHRVYKFER